MAIDFALYDEIVEEFKTLTRDIKSKLTASERVDIESIYNEALYNSAIRLGLPATKVRLRDLCSHIIPYEGDEIANVVCVGNKYASVDRFGFVGTIVRDGVAQDVLDQVSTERALHFLAFDDDLGDYKSFIQL